MCESCNENKKYVDFVHLHNHSHFSLLDGLASPENLVETACNLNYKALALTDHGTCAGLFEFQKECKSHNIKPILGVEIYTTKDHTYKEKDAKRYHITLLAKNKIGMKNIFKLNTIAELEGKYFKPRIDFDLLTKYHEGIICLSGCPSSEVCRTIIAEKDEAKAERIISQYRELFGEDYYIEIMRHKYFNAEKKAQEEIERELTRKLYQISKKLGIKAVATNDCHYSKKDHFKYHDVLLAMQTGDTIKNPKRFTFGSNELYLKSYDEMFEYYKSAPQLLSNTLEIADKIETGLIGFSPDLLPQFKCPEGYPTEDAYLKQLVEDGMKKKRLINIPQYRDRIRFEMDSIIKCGYTRYFLIIWDIINFAKQNNIQIGYGRGSAVGSLALYSLGITKLDPIKYDLLFERFINPERISPPDVDIDFDYYRRDEVFEYIIRKYGKDYCCKIGTYNSFKAKAVVRYAVKALDLGGDWEYNQKTGLESKNSLRLADEISKQIEEGPNVTIDSSLKNNQNFAQIMKKFPNLLESSLRIEGKLSSAGVHAAGIVVCKDPITEHLPLRESHGVVCSQFNKEEVEELGMLKFDCLGLKTVTVIDNTVRDIKSRHGIDLDIDSLEPNDPKVFALFNGKYPNMDNRGIFQFESRGMMSLMKQMRIDSIEDMIAANAIFRPGPLENGVGDLYCDYKHGRKKIEAIHPRMNEILKKTYSQIVFQEDFMKIAQELAGFTKGQSDTLRKCVGRKKIDLLAEQRGSFVAGCVKNNISEDIANKLFDNIEKFGGYGFNKCLSGDTKVVNLKDNCCYTLKELCEKIKDGEKINIVVNSYKDGKIIPDIICDVFETGEKELYEIELTNGMKIKTTMNHRFYCSDGKAHVLQDIIDNKLDILMEENKNLPKCTRFVHNKVFVDEKTKKKIRKMFFQKKRMEYIEKNIGLTSRVIRRIVKENKWYQKRERYLRFLANYGYNNSIPLCKLAKKTGVLIYSLCNIKRKYAIPDAKIRAWNKRINNDIELQMIKMYSSGMVARDIAKKFGFKRKETVYNVLKKHNVERREAKVQTFYNESFFKQIDSHEKAYILGLIMADGYIIKNYHGFAIQLTEKDGYILAKIAKLIGKSTKINKIDCSTKRVKLPNAKNMVRMCVHNKVIADNLKKLGVVRNKSKILRYNGCVPKQFLSSFFRGLIDGDGCIYASKKRVQVQLSSASVLFIKDLFALNPYWFSIHKSNVKYSIDKICPTWNLYVKGGLKSTLLFLKWIYENKSDLYLRRKYEKVYDKIN